MRAPQTYAEEELEELKEEFAVRLGSADKTIAALKVLHILEQQYISIMRDGDLPLQPLFSVRFNCCQVTCPSRYKFLCNTSFGSKVGSEVGQWVVNMYCPALQSYEYTKT